MGKKKEKSKIINVTVGDFTYQFSNELALREQIAIGARREEICFGQYGSMAISADVEQASLAIIANRIAQLEIRHTNRASMPKEFEGIRNLAEDDIKQIWEDFAKQAGLFPGDNKEGNGKGDGKSTDASEKDT